MLSLSLKLSHTTMYTTLIIPTITLVKDPLMPSLSHGMDIEDGGYWGRKRRSAEAEPWYYGGYGYGGYW